MKKFILSFFFIFFIAGCQSNNISDVGPLEPTIRVDDIEPPIPVILVDNQELSYAIGTYSWSENGEGVVVDSVSPPEMIETVNQVASGETLTISFNDDPSAIQVGVWQKDGVAFQKLPSNQVTLPTEPGEFIYVLHAIWPEGESDYILSIRTD